MDIKGIGQPPIDNFYWLSGNEIVELDIYPFKLLA